MSSDEFKKAKESYSRKLNKSKETGMKFTTVSGQEVTSEITMAEVQLKPTTQIETQESTMIIDVVQEGKIWMQNLACVFMSTFYTVLNQCKIY